MMKKPMGRSLVLIVCFPLMMLYTNCSGSFSASGADSASQAALDSGVGGGGNGGIVITNPNSLTGNYVSPLAQASMLAGIVYPTSAPAWGAHQSANARGAVPTDNASPAVSAISPAITSCAQLPAGDFTPCIEQWHAGAMAPNVIWTSLIGSGNCNEVFLPKTSPPSGQISINGVNYPYTTTTLPNGQAEPIYSDGMLQAMAKEGCGPFGNTAHVDLFRLWRPGDTFKVYPAVYPGEMLLLSKPDYYDGAGDPTFDPTDLTIQGVTVNGVRPALLRTNSGGSDSETAKDIVEIGNTAGNITIDNLDIGLMPSGYVLLTLIFDVAGGTQAHDVNGVALTNPTFGGQVSLSHLRVYGGELAEQTSGGANCIMGGGGVGATLQLLNNEIFKCGGTGVQNSSGIGHNVYLPTGTDPNFTVRAIGNWSHDAYVGHDFKSRAQINDIEGNYFEGGLPQGGIFTQADSYNVDIPNAGRLTFKDNILFKTASGQNTNGIMLAYGMEGCRDNRVLSVDIENNTFVQGAATFDGSHQIIPMNFGYPAATPANGTVAVPGCAGNIPVSAINNLFVGVNSHSGWLGTIGETADFTELNQDYTTINKQTSSTGTVGLPAYSHVSGTTTRTLTTVGAED